MFLSMPGLSLTAGTPGWGSTRGVKLFQSLAEEDEAVYTSQSTYPLLTYLSQLVLP